MLKKFIRNLGYTLSSNLLGMVLSAVLVLVLPKTLGTAEYGYYQLFALYCGYIAFLQLGIVDGLYLRYGGKYYENLDKNLFASEFIVYIGIQLLLGVSAAAAGILIADIPEKRFVFLAIGCAAVFMNIRGFMQLLFLATNRIKEYAVTTCTDQISYLFLLPCVLFLGVKHFQIIIVCDLLGKMLSLFYAGFQSRKLLFHRTTVNKATFQELGKNIQCGLNLTFSYLVGISIISIVRLSIEQQWSIETFGKVSLSISVSNLLMIFIKAVAQILFPVLRRVREDRLSELYGMMRTCLMIPLLGMLVLYYPVRVILSAWLPQYAESLVYMAILFPLCVFESKMNMLVSTYMKTLRREKWLLLVNVVTVLLSFLTTAVTVFVYHNLDLAVGSLVFLLAFRCIFAELLISTVLDISVKKDIVLEIGMTAVFIFVSWTVGGAGGVMLYLAAYLGYLFIQRKNIISLWRRICIWRGRKNVQNR